MVPQNVYGSEKMSVLKNLQAGMAGNDNDILQRICEGISNLAEMQNDRLSEVVSALHYIAHQQQEQSALLRDLINTMSTQQREQAAKLENPLIIDYKTYNTDHPDYEASDVRNFPGQIFGADLPSKNRLFKEIMQVSEGHASIPDSKWKPILEEMYAEAKTVPGAEQVFERKRYIESYMSDISTRYGAKYNAGWVNMEDALFLYWMVRKFKPKTIVQTGVCNGLSSAFMMLALAKNGADGTLHVIDVANIFNPNDPAWIEPGKIYGVVIPEGKSSGWIVPDIYKNRFFVTNGDAKMELPKVLAKLPMIDMFYHDSDHTYNHMMFEFTEAKKKLSAGGLIVGDDISWNTSVWDFADKYNVPAYNYKGAVGLAFF